jgi:hypothetical protein
MLPFKLSITVSEFVQLSLFYDPEPFLNECKLIELPNQWIQNLNEITYGNRIDLTELNTENFISLPLKVLHNITDISKLNAAKVLRFSFMVAECLNELNQRDEKYLAYDPEEMEIKAGIKKMNHGVFGVIDTIAKRCPQYTHEDILNLSQQKVFMMLKIDIDNANFAKRLRKLMTEKKH